MRVLHVCMCTVYSKEGIRPPWELELHMALSHLGMMGIECKCSAGAASAPNCWTISPSLGCIIFDMGILCCISFWEGWIFFWKSLLTDRKALYQDSTLTDVTFYFSRDSLWKAVKMTRGTLGLLSSLGILFAQGKQSLRWRSVPSSSLCRAEGSRPWGMSGSFWSGSLGRCGSLRRLQGFPALSLSGNATRWASPTISRYFLLPESGNLETCKKSFLELQ